MPFLNYIVSVIITTVILFSACAGPSIQPGNQTADPAVIVPSETTNQSLQSSPDVIDTLLIRKLFLHMGLDSFLDFQVFERTLRGYQDLPVRNDSVITIIDYSKPSTEERLFIIDLKSQEILLTSLVSHGKNTGANHATSFSNNLMSLKSSPGFYLTDEPYQGKHGYSLKLDGQEKGINDNARNRAIVLHGASYVSYDFIESFGRLGRSWGCPAVPQELTKVIIDQIKGGSCLYIHTDDQDYLSRSSFK